ncbi:MAG: hypothetical protein RLZZ161_1090, partial [Bacteroidota bacterium]
MRKLTLIALSGVSLFTLKAQKNSGFDDGTTVSTGFKPRLLSANKLLIDPTVPKAGKYPFDISYMPQEFKWNTRKIARIMPPVKHFEPGLDTVYNPNYARMGGGNYSHKLMELFVGSRAADKWAYNASFQHLSADAANTNQDFSTNRAYLGGSRFYKTSSMDVRLNYTRDMNRFFAKDTFYEKDAALVKKIGQNVGFNILYDKKRDGSRPGIGAGFMFNNFYNNLNQSETEFSGKLGWDASIKNVGTTGWVEFTSLQFRQNFYTRQQYFIDATPRLSMKIKETGVDFTGGLNMTWVFTDSSSPLFYLNPVILAEKKLEGLKMKMYGGLDGGLRKNSIRRYFEMVPFTFDSIQITNSYDQLRVYAGLKGSITNNSQFMVEFGNNTTSKMPLVVTNNDSINSLQIVYDNINNLYFAADMRFSIGEKLRVGANCKFNNYTTNDQLQAWHLPTFTYALSAQYYFNKNITAQTGMDGMSSRYNTIQYTGQQLKMKGFTDIHLRVDYKVKN